MIYVDKLHDLIMQRHNHNQAKELIILGGWIGPKPVTDVSLLNITSKIIYGCKPKANLTPHHHKIYQLISSNSPAEVFYKDTYNHSKIYCWHTNGKVKEIIAGSANFSTPGLKHDDMETLFDVDPNDYSSVYSELMKALQDSQSCLTYNYQKTSNKKKGGKSRKQKTTIAQATPSKAYPTYTDSVLSFSPPTARISLRDKNGNFSQINSGSYSANTAINDCVIGLKADLIDTIPHLFPNNGINQMAGKGHGRRGKKRFPNAEFLFDDGTIMEMSFEGIGPERENGKYFKNLRSFGSNEVLGIYLRQRMGVSIGADLTEHDFKAYGSDSIDLTLVGNESSATYFADFSPNRNDIISETDTTLIE